MKKFVLTLSIICLAAISLWSDNEGHQNIPIRVLEDTTVVGETHRTPDDVPIHAYYDESCSSIILSFARNLGCVEVAITNTINNNNYDYDFDSNSGIAILPINGESGHYLMLIHISLGSEYMGEFTLRSTI